MRLNLNYKKQKVVDEVVKFIFKNIKKNFDLKFSFNFLNIREMVGSTLVEVNLMETRRIIGEGIHVTTNTLLVIRYEAGKCYLENKYTSNNKCEDDYLDDMNSEYDIDSIYIS